MTKTFKRNSAHTEIKQSSNRRNELKSLTATLKLAVAMGQMPDGHPNELLKTYYKAQGHATLRTWLEWKNLGYNVKKGAKSLLLWSSKVDMTRTIQGKDEEGNDTETELKYSTFNYMCLFSNLQVEKA